MYVYYVYTWRFAWERADKVHEVSPALDLIPLPPYIPT
jgi:hypothetical protein